MARERITSNQLAEATFFNAPLPRNSFPYQAGLMSSILYGSGGDASTRRSKGRPKPVDGAAGYATPMQHGVSDRHPDLQKAIKADSARRCTGSSVGSVVFGTTDGNDAVAVTRSARNPGLQRPVNGTTSDEARSTAYELIYKYDEAGGTAEATTKPRKLRGSGRAIHTATDGNLTSHIFPGEPTVDAGVKDYTAVPATNDRFASGSRTGKRTFYAAPGAVSGDVATVMSAWLGDTDKSKLAGSTNDSPQQGERPSPKPPPTSKRASGVYHPLSGHLGGAAVEVDSALLTQYAQAVVERNHRQGVAPDAGVPSNRLHALLSTAGAICPTPRSVEQRRLELMREGRAGSSPAQLGLERPLFGQTRRQAEVGPPLAKPRNPIFGEVSEISPERKQRLGCSGRLLLSGTDAAKDHLESTLVPDAIAGSPRKSGKATERYAGGRNTFTVSHEAPLPLTSTVVDRPALRRTQSFGSCGKRYIEPPTHDAPFSLSHAVSQPTATRATAAPPQSEPRPARVDGTFKHPPMVRQDTSRATTDATAAYNLARHRGTNSDIFSNMSYPDA